VGIKPTEWGREQTAKGGPFPELLNYDILINAIYLLPEVRLPAFITKGMIDHTPDRSAPFTLHTIPLSPSRAASPFSALSSSSSSSLSSFS
jgi:hypothetical protein